MPPLRGPLGALLLLSACPPVPLDPVVTDPSSGADEPSTSTPTTGADPAPQTDTGGEPDTSTDDSTTGAATDCAEVEFADAGLAAAVRLALQQPVGPLLGADVAALTELSAADAGIVSLAGLQCATGLVALRLGFNDIVDVGPLAGLTGLETLDLYNSAVADLAPLAALTALRVLDLHGADAPDLAPLAAAVQLERLDLAYMPIATLAPLAGLVSLRELSAQGGQYIDLEPLVGLTSLITLDVSGTAISDLAPLAGMSSLVSLTIAETDVQDLAPLAGLPIRRLHANDALILDLAAVASFPTPLALELAGNMIVDVEALLTADWSVPDSENGCLDVALNMNPLSAQALTETLPAFCSATGAAVSAEGLASCNGFTCVMP